MSDKYKYLREINSPEDLRNLEVNELKELCGEIRSYMVDVISEIGGHFGGGLGTVELTVALHKVFNTPADKIVWDTGHQAYPHKIITGRREELKTIRQFGGISGFLKRSESEYDSFGAGHASTSISAALGIATAAKKAGKNTRTVAVIGDGAMTGGMAYEGLNNSGILKSDLIVVLNDNNMSIAPNNVWQISNYFTELISHPEYNRFKGAVWDLTGKMDNFGDRIRRVAARVESGIKSIITPGMLFEALGFRYFGPVNGHNLNQLVKLFEQVNKFNGPILVHILTSKGKGYKPAEKDKQRLHASTPFDKTTGMAHKSGASPVSYTRIFGEALVDIVEKDKKIVGITAAMPDGTGLDYLQKAYPENYYDVGIAEEHAVTFSAGMATEGIIPVVAIYSTFLQRGFDQIIHDVALQKLHVVFVLDRAGLVGADGPTHHGTFDLTYLRMIPNMTIMSPQNENELRNMLFTAIYHIDGPVAIRYPRGNALGVEVSSDFIAYETGKMEKLNSGVDAAVIAVGSMVSPANKAVKVLESEGIKCELFNARFIKPLDKDCLDEIAGKFDHIITIEENSLPGGFGSAVSEYFIDKHHKSEILRLGIPDKFIDHGTQAELLRLLKLDPEGIAQNIRDFLGKSRLHKELAG